MDGQDDDRAPERRPDRRTGGELRPMLVLAGPVILAELGWMAMNVVDLLFVGQLDDGSVGIGAVGLGGILFFCVAIFGVGMLLGLDTLVAHAFGAGHPEDGQRSLTHGLYLALMLSGPLMVLIAILASGLGLLGIDPAVHREAAPYLFALNWSVPPLLIFFACRRYLQAINRVLPIVLALVSANLINVLADWAFVFGNLGAPALGVEGAGWATLLSRTWMMAVLVAAIAWHEHRHQTGFWLRDRWRWESARLRRLVALGLPAALQFVLEVGVFAIATALAARLDPSALAAHQIALNAASISYMIPLGLSSAGAVRVGQGLGRKDPAGARRAGWYALGLGAAFMSIAALAFVLIPKTIISAFTDAPAVVAIGARLLLVAAVFQLFDGLQVVATGVLRGAGDTKTPMLSNLFAYWTLGLPLGYFLCFGGGLGVVGLWIGLSAGLVVVGSSLLAIWARKSSGWGHADAETIPAGACIVS
ncbi:MATE family efflux transporter [soil metagenome]